MLDAIISHRLLVLFSDSVELSLKSLQHHQGFPLLGFIGYTIMIFRKKLQSLLALFFNTLHITWYFSNQDPDQVFHPPEDMMVWNPQSNFISSLLNFANWCDLNKPNCYSDPHLHTTNSRNCIYGKCQLPPNFIIRAQK